MGNRFHRVLIKYRPFVALDSRQHQHHAVCFVSSRSSPPADPSVTNHEDHEDHEPKSPKSPHRYTKPSPQKRLQIVIRTRVGFESLFDSVNSSERFGYVNEGATMMTTATGEVIMGES